MPGNENRILVLIGVSCQQMILPFQLVHKARIDFGADKNNAAMLKWNT
jgi:hypothetical protein